MSFPTDSSASSGTSKSASSWNTIQERLRDSVIAITSNQAFDFGSDLSEVTNATGFVVDAEQGIVLSNRHVMGLGPSYHKGVFFNNTEVFLQPFYCDPTHDFSFFRYDPAELKAYKVKEIPLCPEKAYSGMEFRIVSNNCNEMMSVHSGELSQLDRNVPEYEANRDCNTFYIQSSTTCDGGSSGSPVVNIDGEAVALMAGGTIMASSNFFFPLHRAAYALDYIRRNEIPPRGTMQAVFTHITHSEAERRALSTETAIEQGLDVENTAGVLSVESIIAMGPADGKLKVGDIVISINNKPIPGFIEMSEIVDSSVGKEVDIRVFRDKQICDIAVPVQDFYSITPSRLLHLGNSWLHDMSFLLAAINSVPISGVFISGVYNSFLGKHNVGEYSIIYSINGTPTPNLDALMEVLKSTPRNQEMAIKLRSSKSARDERIVFARCPMTSTKDRLYTRSSATGFWSHEPYMGLLPGQPLENMVISQKSSAGDVEASVAAAAQNNLLSKIIKKAQCFKRDKICKHIEDSFKTVIGSDSNGGALKPRKLVSKQTSAEKNMPKRMRKVLRSMVTITAQSICNADGSYTKYGHSNGLVVDKKNGIILCSNRLVENTTCQLNVDFNGWANVPATLAYSHPLYPVSFLKYDPELLAQRKGKYKVSSLDLTSTESKKRLSIGSAVAAISVDDDGHLEYLDSTVSSRYIFKPEECKCCTKRKYYNVDQFKLAHSEFSSTKSIGVVCDTRGSVRGLLLQVPGCYFKEGEMDYPLGIDISVVLNPLATLKAKLPRDFDDIGILDAQYCPIPLKYAKVHGVKSEYIDEIRQKLPNDNGSLLMVSKILEKRSPDTPSLQVGDVIIKLNGSLIKRIEQMACFYNQKSVEVTIVRDQEEMTLEIPTTTLSKHTTRKVVCWAGFFLQEPTPSMQQKSTTVPSQVFSFCKIIGSPCSDKTDEYNHYIIEIDHTPVKTLDDVVAIARRLKSSDAQSFNADVASNKTFSSGRMPGRDVKVRIVNMNGQEIVMSLRTNDHYFPAWQAVRGPAIEDTWKVEEL